MVHTATRGSGGTLRGAIACTAVAGGGSRQWRSRSSGRGGRRKKRRRARAPVPYHEYRRGSREDGEALSAAAHVRAADAAVLRERHGRVSSPSVTSLAKLRRASTSGGQGEFAADLNQTKTQRSTLPPNRAIHGGKMMAAMETPNWQLEECGRLEEDRSI
jgi:hypothetical protein